MTVLLTQPQRHSHARSARPITVAVTGLNATDNPGPGVGVLRSLRAAQDADYRRVGLAYDALDPGVYAKDLVDAVFMIPYPSQGIEPFLARLEHIQARTPIDVVIPTLDAELPSFIATQPRLADMGIHCVLPTQEQLDMRAKTRLAQLGRMCGLPIPREAVVTSAVELNTIHQKIPYPFFVKGPFYGASWAKTLDQAVAAYHKALATWGPPVVVQEFIDGEEYNVIALGDGSGGLLGAVPMKKMALTDKGKGWAGITIKAPELIELAAQFMKATQWASGCEIEIIRDRRGKHHIIEINPRFPAWVHLSTAAGINLPHLLTQMALGKHVLAQRDYAIGTMFVRISLDQIVPFSAFQQFIVSGELGGTHTASAVMEVAS
jgi:carbamoyl-phosphate synthase large subunit